MNEYIVWYSNGTDKFSKEFTSDDLISQLHYDEICDSPLLKDYKVIEIRQSVGLNDINNNKIYADCSIVEFGYSVGDAVHIGYFYYDKEDLSYRIKILSSFLRNGISNKFKGQSFLFDRGMIDFKIIDTIQQNKLGLIK